MNAKVSAFKKEVERVIPIDRVIPGYEKIQREARQIVVQFEADLRQGYPVSEALQIARVELDWIEMMMVSKRYSSADVRR